MINEYDRVKIIETGDVGIVVDIRETNGTFCLVERDGDNELFDCAESELEKLRKLISQTTPKKSSLPCMRPLPGRWKSADWLQRAMRKSSAPWTPVICATALPIR